MGQVPESMMRTRCPGLCSQILSSVQLNPNYHRHMGKGLAHGNTLVFSLSSKKELTFMEHILCKVLC